MKKEFIFIKLKWNRFETDWKFTILNTKVNIIGLFDTGCTRSMVSYNVLADGTVSDSER